MKKLLSALVIVAVVGFVGYRLLLGTTAGQDMLMTRGINAMMNAPTAAPFDGLRVFVCGSRSPLPDPQRAQACILVDTGEHQIIVDTGAGSPATLQNHGVSLDRLRAVLLTHFHSDHIAALGDINLASWIAGRPDPLHVIGGRGVEKVVQGFNRAYALDRTYRWDHHGKAFLPPELGVMEPQAVKPGTFFDAGGLRVTAISVDHSPISPAYAYRFDYKGRSVVISGDTVTTETLEQGAQAADLLLHDALSAHLITTMADAAAAAGRERQAHLLRDVLDYHAHTTELPPLAERAGVRMLAFYHMVPPPRNELVERIFMRGVPDDVVLTHDGMWFNLPVDSTDIEVIE